jgi:hypothetical protein
VTTDKQLLTLEHERQVVGESSAYNLNARAQRLLA